MICNELWYIHIKEAETQSEERAVLGHSDAFKTGLPLLIHVED